MKCGVPEGQSCFVVKCGSPRRSELLGSGVPEDLSCLAVKCGSPRRSELLGSKVWESQKI